MSEISFDDIETLWEQLSEGFGPWGESCDVSQEMIDAFADLTTDRQWIHVEPACAAVVLSGTRSPRFFLFSR